MSTSEHISLAIWQTLQQGAHLALRAPVAEAILQKAHGALGYALPEPLLDAYRHHNGQTPSGTPLFRNEYRWLSVQEALQEWRVWQDTMARPGMAGMRHTHESCGEAHAKVRMDWWNERWWPLAISGLGDLLCVDGQPGPRGTLHQIIEVSSELEDRSRAAISLGELFKHAAADLAGDLADESDESGSPEQEPLDDETDPQPAVSRVAANIAARRNASAGVEMPFLADLLPEYSSNQLSNPAYSWDFGDGSTANGPHVTHIYVQPGEYKVTLSITDDACRHGLREPYETVDYFWIHPAEVSASVNAAKGGAICTPIGAIVEFPAGVLSGDAVVRLCHKSPSQFALPTGFVPLGEVLIIDTGGAHLNGSIDIALPSAFYNPRGKETMLFASDQPDPAGAHIGSTGSGARLLYLPCGVYKSPGVRFSIRNAHMLLLGAVTDMNISWAAAANIVAPENASVDIEIAFSADLLPEYCGQRLRSPEYIWDFGDGSIATGPQVIHAYARPGEYTVTLSILDDAGPYLSTGPYVSTSKISIHPRNPKPS